MKMALAAVFRQSRRLDNSLLATLKPLSTNGAKVTIPYRFQHQQQHRSKEHDSKQETDRKLQTTNVQFYTVKLE